MSEPLVVRLAEGFRAQLLKRDASAIQAMTSQWSKVQAALEGAINDLTQELAALKADGEDIPQWKLWQMERFQSLLAQIGAEMAAYGQFAVAEIGSQAKKSQALGEAHAKQMLLGLASEAPNGRSLKTTFSKLPVEAVQNLTAIAQAGQPLNKILQAAYPLAVQGLTDQLVYGLSVGQNPRLTAKKMMEQGLGQGLNHFLLVARDQQIRHYREMTRLHYGRNAAIYGYMRLAAKNTRTCLACLALDGTIYPVAALMELHPQDRCTMVPLVEGFPLPKWQSGLDWLEKLPPDELRRMMGNGRYEAYKDGLFNLSQLVTIKPNPTWGPSAQVTSLTDLLKGRGGGAPPIDPAALLATHQAKAKPQKPQTLAVTAADQAFLEELAAGLDKPDSKLDPTTRAGMKAAIGKVLGGHKGFVYTDADGRLQGIISYEPSQSNLQYLNITGAGFLDAAANRRGILDIADHALQQGQGIELYAPNSHLKLYKDWGFLMHQSFKEGARVQLHPDDVAGFLKSPDEFAAKKTAELQAKAKAALADPEGGFTFRVGQEIEGLGFKPVQMGEADFEKQTKTLVYEPPLGDVPEDKHVSAGMLLFTPDGKLVLVDPAHQFGGVKTTFPKGTQEEGMSLQATAVKEVWEETGFKAKVLGHLGDYEKSTSINRFYVGVVEEGAPWAAQWETEAVRIVPLDKADKLLEAGVDKGILYDLRQAHKGIFGGEPFDAAKLEEGLDILAAQKAAEAQPPPPPPTVPATAVATPKLPPPPGDLAALTKKALVDHLAQIRGIAKWKLSVMTKEQVAALFEMSEEEAMAAIEAGGAAHTAKYAGKKQTAVPPAPAKLPPPPGGDPATQTKKALVDHLAKIRGIAKWKLNVMSKDQIAALFALPEADALAAIEAGGAAHTAKYSGKGAKAAPDPKVTAYQKFQEGGTAVLSIEETLAAMDYAEAEGYSVVIKEQLQAAYQEKIGDPLLKTKAGTKAYMETNIAKETGIPSFMLHNLSKPSLKALIGQPVSAVYKAVGKPYTPKPTQPATAAQAAPEAVQPTTPAWPDDLAKANSQEMAQLATKLEGVFTPGSPVGNGAKKALDGIKNGHTGYAYFDGAGQVSGVISFSLLDSQTIKVTGAAFKETAVNLEGMADAANYALSKGLNLKVYVPKSLQAQYKQWGFAVTSPESNGGYMTITPDKIPALVTMAGKVVAQPPAKPKPAPPPVATVSPPKPPPKPKVKKERPLPPNLPPHKLPDPPGFPADVDQLKVVKGLGGSTGAQLVQDAATGKQYVMKKGKSAGHLLEEAYADAAYKAAGFRVPTFKVYETAEGPVKLAEFQEGETLSQYLKTATAAERTAVMHKVRRGFAMDALMGNWDVVGADLDNILVDAAGEVWRIDNGGSLRYRAQGGKKEGEFLTDYPVELWTMRDKSIGPKNEQIFGSLGIYDIMNQVRDVVRNGPQILGALPEEVRSLVNGRLAILSDLADTSDTLKTDAFVEGYTDEFLKHSTYIRREGIIDQLPQRLTQKSKGSTTVYDENGREFDDLWGKDSIIQSVSAYINANGGNSGAIQYWMGQQAGSSWSEGAKAFKYWLVKQRGGDFNKFYWNGGVASAKQAYEQAVKVVGEDNYARTRLMWHAFVYESLRQMEFAGKTADGTLQLVRTEPKAVMDMNKLNAGQRQVTMQRGACESASIYKTVKVYGNNQLTLQKVPIHRIIGYYFTERPNTIGGDAFLGDGENEFVFMPDDIPFDYYGTVSPGKATQEFWQWQGEPMK
ncbi:MAG: NUDIX domain-containing protein [Ardenticatenaceae bacterium]|nr:NUDIX domain-containing protein [Ardenticatenaceae bacterium]